MGVCVITYVVSFTAAKNAHFTALIHQEGKKAGRDALVMIVQLHHVSLPKAAPSGDGKVASESSLSGNRGVFCNRLHGIA